MLRAPSTCADMIYVRGWGSAQLPSLRLPAGEPGWAGDERFSPELEGKRRAAGAPGAGRGPQVVWGGGAGSPRIQGQVVFDKAVKSEGERTGFETNGAEKGPKLKISIS